MKAKLVNDHGIIKISVNGEIIDFTMEEHETRIFQFEV